MRWNCEPEPLADAGPMHSQVHALNHHPFAHLENVRRGPSVTRVKHGHVVLVVADVVINDTITGMDAFPVTIAFLDNRLLKTTTIITAWERVKNEILGSTWDL